MPSPPTTAQHANADVTVNANVNANNDCDFKSDVCKPSGGRGMGISRHTTPR